MADIDKFFFLVAGRIVWLSNGIAICIQLTVDNFFVCSIRRIGALLHDSPLFFSTVRRDGRRSIF